MKTKKQFSLRVFLFLFAAIPTIGFASQSRVQVPITNIYAPKGFDNNDDTQVVVSGYLPNLCYKAPQGAAKAHKHSIQLTLDALFDDASFCPEMIVPYLETISVGALKTGKYKLTANGGSKPSQLSQIDVMDASTSAVDEHVYAIVDYVVQTKGSRHITLKGYSPSDCYVFDRVEFISNDRDTFSVLPIMKNIKADCPAVQVPLTIEADVPTTLKPSKILLHVRIMNGKSVNALFENI